MSTSETITDKAKTLIDWVSTAKNYEDFKVKLLLLEEAQKEIKKSFDDGFKAGVQSARTNDDDGWG